MIVLILSLEANLVTCFGANPNQNETGKSLILFVTLDYHLKVMLTHIDFMCGCAYIATIEHDIVG